ncbi:MAG: hypothetical protein ACPIA7_00985 [Akkermansiaceae bacterium]
MKSHIITLLCLLIASTASPAVEPNSDDVANARTKNQNTVNILKQHGEKAQLLSLEQDELSADVQDLIDEQTDPEVIKMLREIELIMADATDLLDQKNTGGATIATETEVIEKIFEAAKKKQQNQKKDGG